MEIRSRKEGKEISCCNRSYSMRLKTLKNLDGWLKEQAYEGGLKDINVSGFICDLIDAYIEKEAEKIKYQMENLAINN